MTASTTWSPASSGFHRTWLVYLGVELGLFARLRAAGRGGPDARASWPRTAAAGADGDRRLGVGGGRPRARHDRGRPRHARRGHRDRPARRRPPRVPRRAVRPRGRRLARLGRDARLLPHRDSRSRDRPDRYRAVDRAADACRTSRSSSRRRSPSCRSSSPTCRAAAAWSTSIAAAAAGSSRWPAGSRTLELVGVEFEPDSVARARANVEAAGLADRIEIRQADVDKAGRGRDVRPRLLPVRAPPAARPGRRAARGLGGAPPGRPDRRPRLAAAVDAGGVPDAPRRADRRRPARRAVPGHGARDARAVPRLVRRGGPARAGR